MDFPNRDHNMNSRPTLSRRSFLHLGAAALGLPLAGIALPETAERMKIDLAPGRVGVEASLPRVIELADEYGFEAVDPSSSYLLDLSDGEMEDLLAMMEEHGLVFGAANVSVDFRNEEALFREQVKTLPEHAAALQRAGVTRAGTWIMPTHASLTYRENFDRHVRRLRRIAQVLDDHGVRFGLEYVGPRTLWASERYPFVHTMAETKELIDAIDVSNVGFILDSWHWHNAGETKDDILSLSREDVVVVDLNDAPDDVPRDELVDSRRALPMATGVIDTAAFLEGLQEIGYVGPVRAEPFSDELNEMPDERAVAVTAQAMKKAFALIR